MKQCITFWKNLTINNSFSKYKSFYGRGLRPNPKICAINDAKNKTRNIANKIRAISTEMTATPEKPRNPAISANTKKVITKSNIFIILHCYKM